MGSLHFHRLWCSGGNLLIRGPMKTDELNQTGMDNPVDFKPVLMCIAVFMFLIFGAIFVLDGKTEGLILSMFFILMGILILENEFRSSFIHRPTHVLVNNDGLILYFRWSDPRDVAWGEIELVHTSSCNDGSLCVRDEKRPYFLQKQIAEEIRRKYYLAEGRSPPDMKEYWDNQPDGWKKTWTQPMWTKNKN